MVCQTDSSIGLVCILLIVYHLAHTGMQLQKQDLIWLLHGLAHGNCISQHTYSIIIQGF